MQRYNTDKDIEKGIFLEMNNNVLCLDANPVANIDDTDRIQEALDKLHMNGGGKLYLNAGLYRISRILLMYSNTTIEGFKNKTVIDGTNLPQGSTVSNSFLIRSEGISKSSLIFVTDLIEGQTELKVNGDLFEAKPGMLLVIRSTEKQFLGGIGNIPNKEEIHRIVGVNNDNSTIEVDSGLLFNYKNNSTLKAEVYEPTSNICIKNLKIIMGGVGSVHSCIHISYSYNIYLNNVIIDGAENVGISLSRSYIFKIQDCKLTNSTSPRIDNYFTGYGIAINASSCYGVVQNCVFDNCRHGITGGNEAPHHIKIFNNLFTNCRIGYALGCHEPAMYWTLNSNIIQGCESGINGRGMFLTISQNLIKNIMSIGISVGGTKGTQLPYAKQYKITNNDITNTGGRGIELRGHYGPITGAIIENNICVNSLGIRVLEATSLMINNNIIDQTYVLHSPRYGIHIIQCHNVTITGNHLLGVGEHGLFMSESNDLNISNNILNSGEVQGDTNDGFRLNIGKDIIITNNQLHNFKRHSVFSTDVDNVIFVYNIITDKNPNSVRFRDIVNLIDRDNIINRII